VRGDIAIDDSLFDGERWHASWLPTTARAYHAPVGALMANYGAYAVEVAGGDRNGRSGAHRGRPADPVLRVSNQARTGKGAGWSWTAARSTAARRWWSAGRGRAAPSARSSAACSIPRAMRRRC
jgi:hypothetical protein